MLFMIRWLLAYLLFLGVRHFSGFEIAVGTLLAYILAETKETQRINEREYET